MTNTNKLAASELKGVAITMITHREIEATLTKYPGTPNKPRNQEARRQWAVWRVVLDRIISNQHYSHEDPRRFLLLKMATFATEQLGHYNELVYKVTQ